MFSICCDFHVGAGPGFPSLLSQAGGSEVPALPRPLLDLQETELARTAPATFSIPRPSLDLRPSFAINNFQPRQNPPIPVLRSLIKTRHSVYCHPEVLLRFMIRGKINPKGR